MESKVPERVNVCECGHSIEDHGVLGCAVCSGCVRTMTSFSWSVAHNHYQDVECGPSCPVFRFGEKIDHPYHYTPGPMEVYKVLHAWGLDSDAHLWQAIAYIARARKKGWELEDLKKARWYLDLAIRIREGKDVVNE